MSLLFLVPVDGNDSIRATHSPPGATASAASRRRRKSALLMRCARSVSLSRYLLLRFANTLN
jgi:hypothetical protein